MWELEKAAAEDTISEKQISVYNKMGAAISTL